MPNQLLPEDDACDQVRRPGDGSQAWLGMAIAIAAALLTACLLAYAAWRWW